jgi:hypothetical protein
MEQKKRGNYFGTEVDHRWYRRFRKDGMFARGSGVFWLGEPGLFFLRTLTSGPIHIPWTEMTGARLGTWHAGKWAAGRPILKIEFRRHDLDLSAGFLLSTDWDRMRALADDLHHRIEMLGDGRRRDLAQT